MDLLKRAAAPILPEAWEEIDEQARMTLAARLVARRVVDVEGPKGWEFSAVNVGRLDVPEGEGTPPPVRHGLRRVQPLCELRANFQLDIWELDNAARGAKDVELGPLEEAAREIADFESRAIFSGFEGAGIEGMADASEHDPFVIGDDPASFPQRVAEAVVLMRDAGVEGPYALVAGRALYTKLEGVGCHFPPIREVDRLVRGGVHYAPTLEGGLLVSQRGGDFELTLGQDLAVGYESHDTRHVRLFLTESFTFRVLDPNAVLNMRLS